MDLTCKVNLELSYNLFKMFINGLATEDGEQNKFIFETIKGYLFL